MLERIQKIVKEYNLSPTVFADKIDIPKANVSHVLNGRNKPSLDFVLKISEAFPEVNLEWILKGTGTMIGKKEEPKVAPTPTRLAEPIAPPPAPKVAQNTLDFEPKITPTPAAIESAKPTKKAEVKPKQNSNSKKETEGKKMKKIILLYEDNTFDAYDKNEE